MSIYLEIPDSIAQAMRLPEAEQERTILVELAVTLYARVCFRLAKRANWRKWISTALASYWGSVAFLATMVGKN